MKLKGWKRGSSGDLMVFLGQGAEIHGTCHFQGVVRIDGRISGEVNNEDLLIIGDTGEVEAEVKVGSLVVMGKVRGNVEATQRVELQESSVVVGDIKTPRLLVHDGAIFNGNCATVPEEEKVISFSREDAPRLATTGPHPKKRSS